ncbi:hypothetical protein [Sorangium sp. So ce1078]|uniref:hypothetical protein n=1 Tax=Sorangium sp. So ce1078 TaxID=3133329 RepID=UPI003F6473B4
MIAQMASPGQGDAPSREAAAPESARPTARRDATTVGLAVWGLDASPKLSRSTRPPEKDPSAPPPAPSTPARPASLGWLHLTDLHQGMSGTSWLWPKARVRVFPRRMFTSAGGRKIDRDVSAYHLDERGSFAYEVPTARRT